MTELNQVQYYEKRETEQRQRARAAKMPDIVSFHTELADRYRQLASEARMLLPHQVA